MKKIIIEINYNEEKDIYFHLGIVRTQIRNLFKNSERLLKKLQEENDDVEIEQEGYESSHKIIVKKQ